MRIELPYGKSTLPCDIPDRRLAGVLRGGLDSYTPAEPQEGLVEAALAHPVGSPGLCELARGKRRVTVIISDHTRPVPSRVILPPMLREIRRGNPDARITLLVATGCHRETTAAELTDKCGADIVARERIVVHDCDCNCVRIGTLPSGGELWVNREAADCDLLVSEGFIEPHFFAGFSGGRKSVLPGIASRGTVMYNHNAAFLASSHARAGILDGNPIHRDMLYAARTAKLAFICNVVINARHEVVAAYAGDCDAAHREGVQFLEGLCAVPAASLPIVVTTNNGAPLDLNIYQAVKGMSTAEMLTPEGGVIIMAAACGDGHGGEGFLRFFEQTPNASELLEQIEAVPAADTTPDQWQAQVLARILSRRRVILISRADPELVRRFGIVPACDFPDALRQADTLAGEDARILVVPEGVSVIPQLD